MKSYVVGLLFDEPMRRIVYIHKKTGPPCVVGLWNGVGGKIEPGEEPVAAMRREFREETGVDVPEEEWEYFCTLKEGNYDVYFFFARNTKALESVRTVTEEQVAVWHVWDRPIPGLLRNIYWMVPFLCDQELQNHCLGELPLVRGAGEKDAAEAARYRHQFQQGPVEPQERKTQFFR